MVEKKSLTLKVKAVPIRMAVWEARDFSRVRFHTQQLIKEVNDEEILHSIAGYVSGIDWSGTPYDI